MTADHVEAKLHAFRRTKDGVVVSFVLHPQEVPDKLATDDLGTRYMLAFAEIGDDEQPVEKPEKANERKPFKSLPRSQQAALACNDVAFQRWLRTGNEEDAAKALRLRLNVASRANLDSYPDLAAAWDRLYARFEEETGRVPA